MEKLDVRRSPLGATVVRDVRTGEKVTLLKESIDACLSMARGARVQVAGEKCSTRCQTTTKNMSDGASYKRRENRPRTTAPGTTSSPEA